MGKKQKRLWWVVTIGLVFALFVLVSCCLPLQHEDFSAPAIVACPAGTQASKHLDRRQNKTSLRIATYNAEWLFDGIDDHERVPWQTRLAADAHLVKVSEVIASLQADLINIAEVGGCFMLHRICELVSGYSPFLVSGKDSATRQQVGLITRLGPTGR